MPGRYYGPLNTLVKWQIALTDCRLKIEPHCLKFGSISSWNGNNFVQEIIEKPYFSKLRCTYSRPNSISVVEYLSILMVQNNTQFSAYIFMPFPVANLVIITLFFVEYRPLKMQKEPSSSLKTLAPP